MRASRMFCQGGSSNFDLFFVRGEDPNTTKSGHHWSAVDDGPTLNAGWVALWFLHGIRTSIMLRNPIALSFFRGGGIQTPCPLPYLDPRMTYLTFSPEASDSIMVVWTLKIGKILWLWYPKRSPMQQSLNSSNNTTITFVGLYQNLFENIGAQVLQLFSSNILLLMATTVSFLKLFKLFLLPNKMLVFT